MSLSEQKYVKKHLQNYRLWLKEGSTDFGNFWRRHFWHYLPSISSRLIKCLFLHYLGKPKQAKWDKNAIFCWFCFPR